MGKVPYTTNEMDFKYKAEKIKEWIDLLEQEFSMKIPARHIPTLTVEYCYGIISEQELRLRLTEEGLNNRWHTNDSAPS